jgi:hypothetical protein
VAERRQPAADVMRASARLHADQAAGNISKLALNLTSGYFPPHNHGTSPVEGVPRSIPIVVMAPDIL